MGAGKTIDSVQGPKVTVRDYGRGLLLVSIDGIKNEYGGKYDSRAFKISWTKWRWYKSRKCSFSIFQGESIVMVNQHR